MRWPLRGLLSTLVRAPQQAQVRRLPGDPIRAAGYKSVAIAMRLKLIAGSATLAGRAGLCNTRPALTRVRGSTEES